jgi:hypothetical protein
MKLPAASGRGIKADYNLFYFGGHVVSRQTPLPRVLPHRERMGYTKGHNKIFLLIGRESFDLESFDPELMTERLTTEGFVAG